jgi:hypothetical protein
MHSLASIRRSIDSPRILYGLLTLGTAAATGLLAFSCVAIVWLRHGGDACQAESSRLYNMALADVVLIQLLVGLPLLCTAVSFVLYVYVTRPEGSLVSNLASYRYVPVAGYRAFLSPLIFHRIDPR